MYACLLRRVNLLGTHASCAVFFLYATLGPADHLLQRSEECFVLLHVEAVFCARFYADTAMALSLVGAVAVLLVFLHFAANLSAASFIGQISSMDGTYLGCVGNRARSAAGHTRQLSSDLSTPNRNLICLADAPARRSADNAS